MKYPPPQVKFPKAVGVITVQTIEVSDQEDLSKFWSMISEKSIPKTTRLFWNKNGIRVGITSLHSLKKISQSLPTVYSSGSSRMTGSSHPLAIAKSNRLSSQVNIYLPGVKKSSGNHKSKITGHVVHITGGKAQLLAALIGDPSGRLFLDITPHHYQREFSLLPKPPLQNRLEGKIYHDLTLRISVRPGAIIVLGLYRRATDNKEKEKEKKKAKPEKNDLDASKNKTKKLPKVTPVQNNLGSAIMTDTSFNRVPQKLLFINVRALH